MHALVKCAVAALASALVAYEATAQPPPDDDRPGPPPRGGRPAPDDNDDAPPPRRGQRGPDGPAAKGERFAPEDDNGPPPRQGGGPGGRAGAFRGGPGGFGPPDPLFRALDVNHDGVISSDELKKAASSLLTLDRDKNGRLTLDEIHPNGPLGRGGQFGPPGRGGQFGPPGRGGQFGPPGGGQLVRRVAVSLARRVVVSSARRVAVNLDLLPVAVVRRTEPMTPMVLRAVAAHRRAMTTTARPRLTMRRRLAVVVRLTRRRISHRRDPRPIRPRPRSEVVQR